jgi:hypothetical protein
MPRSPREYEAVHKHSIRNRSAIERSERCGCFYCRAIFAPGEITEWVDGGEADLQLGVTALCPRCGIDSVLPSGAGIEITPELLSELCKYYF